MKRERERRVRERKYCERNREGLCLEIKDKCKEYLLKVISQRNIYWKIILLPTVVVKSIADRWKIFNR